MTEVIRYQGELPSFSRLTYGLTRASLISKTLEKAYVPYLARFRQQKESARVVKVWRTFSWKKFALLSSWCVHESLMTSSHVGQ